jgi:GTP cyclohydrolase I
MSDHERIVAATRELLLALKLDVDQDPGIKDTPERVARAWKEMTSGYEVDPAKVLCTTFPSANYDEMIVCSNIAFTSVCEHHLLPFTGTAHVGYIPSNGKVVGLSKLARLVDCYARRLQIQERMTEQVLEAMKKHLEPRGAGVILQAHHMCMSCRGVMKAGAVMSTAALLGSFKENPATRAEFMRYAR